MSLNDFADYDKYFTSRSRPWWQAEQGAHDVRLVDRRLEFQAELVAECAPCGWRRAWGGLAMLARGKVAIAGEVTAAIAEHIRPAPLTLGELADLGWFEEEA